MITTINRKLCLDKYPNFPQSRYDDKKEEGIFFYPKVFASYVLTIPSTSLSVHINLLAKEWARVSKALGFDAFIFLGDSVTPWLYQDNAYKPVRHALDFLIENKIGKRFNGGIAVDLNSLNVFVKHLSWLVRCNAAMPYIYFMDKGQNIMGTICQYGNIHINTMNKSTDKNLKQQLGISKFELLKGNVCYNQFEKSGAIKGRKISS